MKKLISFRLNYSLIKTIEEKSRTLRGGKTEYLEEALKFWTEFDHEILSLKFIDNSQDFELLKIARKLKKYSRGES